MDYFQRMVGQVRRCVDDYAMFAPGDSVAVGVSGGKDSLLTLAALAALRRYYPAPFTLRAFTVDCGFPDMDFGPVADWIAALDVPYEIIKTDIREIVFDVRKEPNPCSLCAKLRRGALNSAALAAGCNKVALGHHLDDAVNTFLLSWLYEGRLSCFEPVTHLDRSGVTQIRPLLYVPERDVVGLTRRLSLPVVKSTCPSDRDSKRREVQALASALAKEYPDFKERTFRAIQRLPLPGWEKPAGT